MTDCGDHTTVLRYATKKRKGQDILKAENDELRAKCSGLETQLDSLRQHCTQLEDALLTAVTTIQSRVITANTLSTLQSRLSEIGYTGAEGHSIFDFAPVLQTTAPQKPDLGALAELL